MDPTAQRLTLRVTRIDGREAPAGPTKTFDAQGGTIGRAERNDWALADPTRTLSSHHATVFFDQGRFHLVDCSVNGVYLNEQAQPLGVERIATLAAGDRLVLGPYEVVVELTAALDPLQLLSGPAARAEATAAPAAPSSAWDDLGLVAPDTALPVGQASVDPLELLGSTPTPPRERIGRGAQRNDAPVLASAFRPPRALAALPEDWLEPTPAPKAAPAPDATRDAALAIERARAALHEALAALDALKSRHLASA